MRCECRLRLVEKRSRNQKLRRFPHAKFPGMRVKFMRIIVAWRCLSAMIPASSFAACFYQRRVCPAGAAGLCAAALPGTGLDVDARLLGLWRLTATTGCRARGCLRLMLARCGRPATGAGRAACMCGIPATGDAHVGYYGGVNYGFGYMGIGFVGGVWAGGAFRYNTAVMHVGRGIHNTYCRPTVVERNTIVNNGTWLTAAARAASIIRPPAGEADTRTSSTWLPHRTRRGTESAARTNANNYFNHNGGHPANAAMDRPMRAATRAVRLRRINSTRRGRTPAAAPRTHNARTSNTGNAPEQDRQCLALEYGECPAAASAGGAGTAPAGTATGRVAPAAAYAGEHGQAAKREMAAAGDLTSTRLAEAPNSRNAAFSVCQNYPQRSQKGRCTAPPRSGLCPSLHCSADALLVRRGRVVAFAGVYGQVGLVGLENDLVEARRRCRLCRACR